MDSRLSTSIEAIVYDIEKNVAKYCYINKISRKGKWYTVESGEVFSKKSGCSLSNQNRKLFFPDRFRILWKKRLMRKKWTVFLSKLEILYFILTLWSFFIFGGLAFHFKEVRFSNYSMLSAILFLMWPLIFKLFDIYLQKLDEDLYKTI
jgi:hypothetical protein